MRFLSVLAGAASILLIHRLGRRLYDQKTALLAAGFTAVSFTHTLNSAFATQDVIIGFLILACYLTLTRAATLGQLIASGALLGVLLGTKLSSVSVLVAMPVLASVEIWSAGIRGKTVVRATRDWIVWGVIYLSSAFVVFAVTNPHVLLNFAGFVKYWGEAKVFWFDHTSVPCT
jgi:4-amino-4-deoxy-L-arabinose transferase-like glycosyltransferase